MQTLVCPVNTVGVMGKGLALQFAERFPGLLPRYKWRCNVTYPHDPSYRFRAGMTWLCRSGGWNPEWDKWIICFATKGHWRVLSELEYIETGLQKIARLYEIQGITSIAFPKLGCGLGRLAWPDVKLLFDKYLDLIDIPVEVYIYD